jgi:hypothetical protein
MQVHSAPIEPIKCNIANEQDGREGEFGRCQVENYCKKQISRSHLMVWARPAIARTYSLHAYPEYRAFFLALPTSRPGLLPSWPLPIHAPPLSSSSLSSSSPSPSSSPSRSLRLACASA